MHAYYHEYTLYMVLTTSLARCPPSPQKLRLELTQLNEKLLQSEQRHVAALKASQAQQQELNTLTARVVTLQADVRGREEAVVQAQQANAVLQVCV